MRILIVDDEKNITRYLAESLRAEGFSIDCAYDGITALEKATTTPYDAITLDIMLPGMSGYEVCKRLRAAEITTPVLMLTAKDGEYDEADALDIGADDFLRKPFSLIVLVARLRALLRRGGASRGSTLTVGDLVLEERTHTVTRAGDIIELTPREYDLLYQLMANKGTALSKTLLLDRVWGFGPAGDQNVVEVYIGYLRKKIDAPYPNNLIHTVRGVGYRIAEESA